MTGMFDTAREYAQSHPLSVATGLIIALPGAYLFITGNSPTCAIRLCNNMPSPSHSAIVGTTEGLSDYQSQHPLDLRFNLAMSKWSDKPAPTFVVRIIEVARQNIISFLNAIAERLELDVHYIFRILEDRWTPQFPLSRFGLVATTTALPGAFLVFIRNHPDSWAAKHQNQVANVLHVLALVTVANQRISIQDILVTALVMVSFEAFQRSLGSVSAGRESPVANGTRLSQTHAESDILVSLPDEVDDTQDKSNGLTRGDHPPTCKDEEILRLQRALTEAKTSEKVKEIELKRTQNDLRNARETLNETFAEYSSLRDEIKTMKQTIGRDHQAIIYRKDIELFALRKANEQKENYIKEKDSKLDETNRQRKATLELKDAQLQNLKERVAFLERNDTREEVSSEAKAESQVASDHQAVQVKLLRVKGRNSLDVERSSEDKDAEIAKLKGELAGAAKASKTLALKQDELRRAWDATYEVQNALSEEQQLHVQTKELLQEATVRLDEELRRSSQKNSPTRLPTIQEQDKRELETMFNSAQQDNLRLYSELDALDKRLREANARIFVCDQEIEALREHLRLEKAITEDMETARPSLVHRVHFQRMEGQLKESRDALETKEDEIERLKKKGAAKDSQLNDLAKAKDEALHSHAQLQEESEQLKKTIKDLEATKEQLMLDHERLAQHRSRQRTTSAEHTSARSSDATLITDPNIQALLNLDEPLPTRPVTLVDESSIQTTPPSAYRSDTNHISMISNDIPPVELRTTRRKSLTLKGLMRKITKKDPEAENKPSNSKDAKEQTRPKTALAPKDKNTLMRPKTAAAPVSKTEGPKEKAREAPRPQTAAPAKDVQTPTRYYAAQENITSTGEQTEKEDSGVDTSSPRPKSRGWSTSRKLVRKSVG
ncbi:hypothetical protein K505DRAFT_365900 [Melanomma pulvis-pyrius CBS 109.77]|uniref:Uncharacterized protein n=1 Tax=Melanomma pulvis-pyrius CBS 109.77 TaxID=1314802 RepID=A0A6A6WYX6_9PLEO|nr:hypothetical protein K505DRAFT_365900 [Melanomma pulvis-pyrius CBS 109.77]